MIKIENYEVMGWEHAIRGMRNPMNSWDKSDSGFGCSDGQLCVDCTSDFHCTHQGMSYNIGPNDHDLMLKLAMNGSVHAKYRRMITVYVDITAPLYWWKEFDTYKVGTVANSCSTMHKIAEKEFTLEDFSFENVDPWYKEQLVGIVRSLNQMRNDFNKHGRKEKTHWYSMIQLLPSSYNQKRTVMLNYEVLAGIYQYRREHKLDEWREFCKWIEGLPYSEIITCGYEISVQEVVKNLNEGKITMNQARLKLGLDRIEQSNTGCKDEVGGYHDGAIGWNPNGVWCGECTRASCKGCKSADMKGE